MFIRCHTGCLSIFLLLSAHVVNAQFFFGAGYDLAAIHTNDTYESYLRVYNENETWDLYKMNQELGVLSQGVSIRNYGQKFESDQTWAAGYSIEMGYRYFRSKGQMMYQGSSTDHSDSIVNVLGGYRYKTRYHIVRFTHYFDVHYNPSEKVKISQAIGVGLNALVKVKTPGVDFDGAIISPNYPTLTFNYQPQITEKYERFYVSCFVHLNLFRIPLFTKPSSPFQQPDSRTWLSEIRMQSIGVRIIPRIRQWQEKEKEEHENY